MPLIARLFSHLHNGGAATAFRFRDHRLSYDELDNRARRYAAGLTARGVQKGDRVVAILETSLDLVTALIGHHYLGAIHVPVNTRYGELELRHIIGDADPAMIVIDAASPARELVANMARPVCVVGEPIDEQVGEHELAFEDLLRAAPISRSSIQEAGLGDTDLALFIYTSGTTGPSKGVELPYGALISGIDALTTLWQWTPHDLLALALPLFHVHGLCIGVHGTLLRGNGCELFARFDPAQIADSIDAGATIFMGVPTMYARILEAMDAEPQISQKLRAARLFTSGSAALPARAFERFEQHTGHRILERYGMSETLLTFSNPYDGERRPGTVGRPVPGVEARVVDDDGRDCAPDEPGELWVRGPSVMRGYWRAPEKTAEVFRDGWFTTGDVVTRAADGYVSIVGRKSVDIIKSGGFKISAREIEDALRHHPQIRDVAIVGLPDETFGESIAAAIVTAEATPDPQAWLEMLQEFLAGTLAGYKRPRQVRFYDELPCNALGKIQKHHIIGDFQRCPALPHPTDMQAGHR